MSCDVGKATEGLENEMENEFIVTDDYLCYKEPICLFSYFNI